MDILRTIKDANLNDVLYILMQLTLLWLTLYSIYHQTINIPLEQRVRLIRKNIVRWFRQTREKYIARAKHNYKRIRLALRIDKPNKHLTAESGSLITGNSSLAAKLQLLRGENSWQYFGLAWTVMSVLYIEVNSAYEPLQRSQFTILVTLINLASISWLCFYSRWFRNWIIRITNHRNKTPD